MFIRISGLKDLAEENIPLDLPKPELSENQAAKVAVFFDQNDRARNTPTALSSLYQIRQSELRYKLQSTRLLPKFDFIAGISQQNVTNFANNVVRQNATNERAAGISANWTIFDGFATTGYKRSALADRRAAEQQLKNYLQVLDEQKRSSFRISNCRLACCPSPSVASRWGAAVCLTPRKR